MKTPLICLALLAGLGVSAPAPTTPATTPAATNGMIFSCENGGFYNVTNLILRSQVKVFDQKSGMYLECDLLTVNFHTNATKQAVTNRATAPKSAPGGSRTEQFDSSSLDSIIAEGHVYITTAEQQIVGDRAVYTATNQLFVVTGEMVILGFEQGVGICKKAVFDRNTGTAHSVGESVFESLGQTDLAGTNSAFRKRSTNSLPANATPPAAKPPSPP